MIDILFVSHNIEAVQALCTKTVLLDSGKIQLFDTTEKVVSAYMNKIPQTNKPALRDRVDRAGDGRLRVTNFKLMSGGVETKNLVSGETGELWFEYVVNDKKLTEIDFSIGIDALPSNHRIATISSVMNGKKIKVNSEGGLVKFKIDKLALNAGHYQFTVFVDENKKIVDWVRGVAIITVDPGHFYSTGKMPEQGNLLLDYTVTNE